MKKPHISSLIPPDFDAKAYKDTLRERIESEKKEKENKKKEEEQRIKNLKCPCCKDTEKEHKRLSIRSGPLVCGGKNSSTELAEYYICLGCGVMYIDLEKKLYGR